MTGSLAILGTCVSQDWMHYVDPEKLEGLKLLYGRQHSALVSQFSQPVDYGDELGASLRPWERETFRRDLEKSFLNLLKQRPPTVILVDLLLDARFGCLPLRNSWVTNSYLLKRSDLLAQTDASQVITATSSASYREMFGKAVSELAKLLRHDLAGCRVILHRCGMCEAYRSRSGDVIYLGDDRREQLRQVNNALRLLEREFCSSVDCEQIDIWNDAVLADEQHIWGMGEVHYERAYQRRLGEELLARIGNGD